MLALHLSPEEGNDHFKRLRQLAIQAWMMPLLKAMFDGKSEIILDKSEFNAGTLLFRIAESKHSWWPADLGACLLSELRSGKPKTGDARWLVLELIDSLKKILNKTHEKLVEDLQKQASALQPSTDEGETQPTADGESSEDLATYGRSLSVYKRQLVDRLDTFASIEKSGSSSVQRYSWRASGRLRRVRAFRKPSARATLGLLSSTSVASSGLSGSTAMDIDSID